MLVASTDGSPEGIVPVPPSQPRPIEPPGKMALPELSPLNTFSLCVHWTPPADMHSRRARVVMACRNKDRASTPEAHLPVLGFRLRYISWGENEEDSPMVWRDWGETWPPTDTAAVLKNIPGGREYIFQICAFNAAGNGPWSDDSAPILMPSATGPDGGADQGRGAPTFLSTAPDSIEVQWKMPCHRGAPIESYDILCSQDPEFKEGSDIRTMSMPGDATSLLVNGLRANAVYYFKYRAVNAKGCSKWSQTTPGASTAALPPERPSPPVRLGDMKPFEVSIRWEPSECYNIPIQHYRVRRALHQDMREALEVEIGGTGRTKQDGIPINADGSQVLDDSFGGSSPSTSTAASSPTARRPGFSRGGYALTQLKVKGLSPGYEYFFQVMACNQVGNSEWSLTSEGMRTHGAPPARCQFPRYISGSRARGMRIYWPVPEGFGLPIGRYDVRVAQHARMEGDTVRLVESVNFKIYDLTARKPGEEFVETTMSDCWDPGVHHFYQVRAVTDIGLGEWSESSEAMLTDPEPPLRPDPPHDFKILPRSVVVFWKAAQSRGSPITGYRLRYTSAPNIADSVTLTTGASVRVVEAIMHDLTGEQPNEKELEPGRIGEVLRKNTKGDVLVKWDLGAEQWLLTKDFNKVVVDYQEVSGMFGTSCSHPVAGLTPHHSYSFQVMAINAIGSSPWSTASRCLTVKQEPPHKMAAPYLLEATATTMLVAFPTPADAGTKDGELIQSYTLIHAQGEDGAARVEAAKKKEGKEVVIDRKAVPTGTLVSNLRPGTVCAFMVYAVNEYGISEPSDVSQFMTLASAPEAPEAPVAVEVTRWSAIARFTPGFDSGSPLLRFKLRCQHVEDRVPWDMGPWEMSLDKDGLQFCGANNLKPGLVYQLSALVTNEYGDSPWSEWSEPFTTETAPPDHMGAVTVDWTESTQFQISWEAPFVSNEPLTEYVVRWSVDETMKIFKEVTVPVAEPRINVCTELTPGKLGYAMVAAGNRCGCGPFSPLVTVQMKNSVPTAPARPRAIDVGPTHAKLSWMIPYDSGEPITHFWINFAETETDGRPESERHNGEVLVTGRRHHCIVIPLLSEREYVAQIAAENACGIGTYSPWSKPFRIGRAELPLTPSVPTFISSDLHNIVARWNQPEHMGAEILEQIVRVSKTPDFQEGTYRDVVVPCWSESLPAATLDFPKLTPIPKKNKPMWQSRGKSGANASATSPRGDTDTRAEGGGADAAQQSPAEGAEGKVGGEGGDEEQHQQQPSLPGDEQQQQQQQQQQQHQTRPTSQQQHGDEDDEAGEDPLAERRARALQARMEGAGIMALVQKLACKREANYTIVENLPGTGYYLKVAARNAIGQGPWSDTSSMMATAIAAPDPVPKNPGIECLRSGCTSLAFVWQRPPCCWGAPVTHYVVRFAESEEGLWDENCGEFGHEEQEVEAWIGMLYPGPTRTRVETQELPESETLAPFAEYLLVKFGTMEESWRWLDVSKKGAISQMDFLAGDDDHDAPFADFSGAHGLEEVWRKLSEGKEDHLLTFAEFGQLQPYMESVQKGRAGTQYTGVYCLLPGLTPGKNYFIAVRAVNQAGMSDWTCYVGDSPKTQAMSPMKMDPLVGVRDARALDSVTFRWTLPYSNGSPINRIEIRYFAKQIGVKETLPTYADLRNGQTCTMLLDESVGTMPTECSLYSFDPANIVFASARAYNDKGAAREWSDLPGPGEGSLEDPLTWDSATLPCPPGQPEPPKLTESMMWSESGKTYGSFEFDTKAVGQTFLRYLLVQFELFDSQGNTMAEFERKLSDDDVDTLFDGRSLTEELPHVLEPGHYIALRMRTNTAAGWSEWSWNCELVRTPADRPFNPAPLASEFTSVHWVELKWFAPHANGAEIQSYDVLYKLAAKGDDAWKHVDAAHLAENTHDYGHDGRRTHPRNAAAMVYRVEELQEGCDYTFKIRAQNSVGWSGWSEESVFRTKAVKPSRVDSRTFEITACESRRIAFSWTSPPNNGDEIIRFEVVGSCNVRAAKWARLTQLMLSTTVDLNRLDGFPLPCELELGESIGMQDLAAFKCEESFFSSVAAPKCSFDVMELLPGQDYIFCVRAVNNMGRSDFSDFLGPITTLSEKPAPVAPVRLVEADEGSCRFAFQFPYNMGSDISEAEATLVWTAGPLAAHEMDPETGEALPHLMGQTFALDVNAAIISLWVDHPHPTSVRVHDVTAALTRTYVCQGAAAHFNRPDWVPTRATPTGVERQASVKNLVAGTCYRIRWRCANEHGWTDWSVPTEIMTEAMRPDTPEDLFIPSL